MIAIAMQNGLEHFFQEMGAMAHIWPLYFELLKHTRREQLTWDEKHSTFKNLECNTRTCYQDVANLKGFQQVIIRLFMVIT